MKALVILVAALVGCAVDQGTVVVDQRDMVPGAAGLEVHKTRADAEGGRAQAKCPSQTVMIGGGCVCNLGQLYASGWSIEDNTGESVWECGCSPLSDYVYGEPPFTLATQAQAICMGEAP